MSCVNDNCSKEPSDSLFAVVVSIDGDMACCPECKREYEKQRDHFFTKVVHDDKKFNKWIKGEE